MTTKDTKASEWSEHLEMLARQVVNGAFKVHSELGPGLLESIYEACMLHELAKHHIPVRRQVPLSVTYDGQLLDMAMRLDLLASDAIVVEIKAVEKLIPIHQAQMLSYLKLSHKRIVFLINFNVMRIRDGIRRLVL